MDHNNKVIEIDVFEDKGIENEDKVLNLNLNVLLKVVYEDKEEKDFDIDLKVKVN